MLRKRHLVATRYSYQDMPKTIFSLLLLGFALLCNAQSPTNIVTHIDTIQGVTLQQPDGLKQRLEFQEQAAQAQPSSPAQQTKPAGSTGFRVEVFADNNPRSAKSQAQARRQRIAQRLPQYATYLVFESPYWRVRVGDFRSRQEAEMAMAEIRKLFPTYSKDLRIIRTAIK